MNNNIQHRRVEQLRYGLWNMAHIETARARSPGSDTVRKRKERKGYTNIPTSPSPFVPSSMKWRREKKKSYVSLNINICKQGERTPFHAQVDPRDLYDVLNLYGLCTCVFVLFCFFSSRRSACSKTETQRGNHWYKLYRTLWNPKGILIVFVLLDPGVTSI